MRTSLYLALLSGLATNVNAQIPTQSGDSAGALTLSQPSPELGGAAKRAWNIVPSVTVQETFTDNVALGQSGGKASDQISEVAPGVRLDGNTARAKIHLDYQLRQLYYAQGSRGSQTQNSLNSFGTLEAVEKLFFVDVGGNISRQNISAFGAQSAGYYSDNSNSTETRNFRVSPYFKGRLGSYADYVARYTRSALRTKSNLVSDSDTQEWLGRLSGNTPLSFLGWTFDASRQNYDYSRGRNTESDRLRGQLTFRVDPQLRLLGSIGRESNDFLSLNKQVSNTTGYGVEWNPTERTQVSAFREKRFFGNGHNVSIKHRLRRSAVSYTDSRDISALPTQAGASGMGNIYDLLFSRFASSISDEATRASYVNDLLRQNGIAPNTQVNAGFLTSQVTTMRRQELAYVLTGIRNTVTLAINRTRNDRLGTGLGVADDFSAVSGITQQGFNAGWAHQLSAGSSLNVVGSRSRTTGAGGTKTSNTDSTQKSLSASFTTKLGAKTQAALTARRTEVDGSSAPYTENAVIGSVSMQF